MLSSRISSNGGSGSGGSAGGSGGAIHLKANSLNLTENSLIEVSGGSNGGAGGRIFLEADTAIENKGLNNLLSKGGQGAVNGTSGSVRFLRPANLSSLDFQTGTLIIDTIRVLFLIPAEALHLVKFETPITRMKTEHIGPTRFATLVLRTYDSVEIWSCSFRGKIP